MDRIIKINVKGLKTKNIKKFKSFQGNLKEISEENLKKLKESIKRNGFNAPIFIWKDHNYILDGHQRIKAVDELIREEYTLKNFELPYVEIEAKDKKQAAEMVLSYNQQYGKITQEGFLEFKDAFQLDMSALDDFIDLEQFDFETSEQEAKEDDFDTEQALEKPKYDVKRGDIWILGNHRLMCGDATSKEDVDKLMNGQKVDMVLTDPPYGIGKDIENDNMSGNEFLSWNDEWIRILPVKENSTFISYHSTRTFPYLLIPAQNRNWFFERAFWFYRPDKFPVYTWKGWMLVSQIILMFSKGDVVFKKKKPADHDCYKFTSKDLDKSRHPTQKIIKNIVDLLEHFETNIVYDCFGGSGTTLIACEQLNRNCYMMELDPKYCSVIIERWEKLSGKKAKKKE